MLSEECSAFRVHPLCIRSHPNQMASGMQIAVLSVRNALHCPLHVSNRHQVYSDNYFSR